MTIPSPQQLLSKYSLSPKHSFGQNFLCDRHLIERIAALAVYQDGVNVIELGAGLGALTDELARRNCMLTAVERDRDLVPILRDLFAESIESGRLALIEGDAKQVDFLDLALRHPDPNATKAPLVITGNLPYQITGPLLEKTIRIGRHVGRAVFLVQKEVADRLAASCGTKEYGALTVFVQAQFAVERAFTIKPGAFHPRPRVDSAVVVLRPHATIISEETSHFRRVVKAAFAARRKTLRNAWRALGSLAQLDEIAKTCGISLDQRGETLSPEQFAQVARTLEQLGGDTESQDEVVEE